MPGNQMAPVGICQLLLALCRSISAKVSCSTLEDGGPVVYAPRGNYGVIRAANAYRTRALSGRLLVGVGGVGAEPEDRRT